MSEIEKLKSASSSGRLKFIAKDTIIYGGATAVSRMLYVFIIPVLARVLTKSEYGAVDGLTVLSLVFGLVVIFGLDSSVARFFYEAENDQKKREVVTNAFVIQLITSVFLTGLLLYYSSYISEAYLGDPGYTKVFQIMVISMPFASAVQFFQNLLKWVFLRKQFIILATGFTFSFLALTLVFVLHYDMGVAGVFYAKLISSVIFTLLGGFYCRRYFTMVKRLEFTKRLLSYGWPYMLIGVLGALVPSLDRYYITKHLGLDVMAVYAIGFRVSSLLRLVVTGFQTAWGPFAFAIYKEEDAAQTYNNVLTYYTILLVIMGVCIALLAEPIVLIFASAKYMESTIVIVPLVFAVIVDSICWITGIGISISKKTYYTSLSYGIGLLATLIGIYFLISPYGITGVAVAVLLGRFSLTISMTIFSYMVYPIKFDLARPTILVFIGLGLSLACHELNYLSLPEQVLIRIGCLVVFCLLIWYKFTPSEAKQKITQYLSNSNTSN